MANGFDDEPRYPHEQSKGGAKSNCNANPNADTAGLHNTQSRDYETDPADWSSVAGDLFGIARFQKMPAGCAGAMFGEWATGGSSAKSSDRLRPMPVP